MKFMLVFLAETDMHGEIPMHEAIIRRLSQGDVHGATVLRGIMGFGAQHKVHRQRLFGVSDDRPVVIVVGDEESRLRAVIPSVRALVPDAPIFLMDAEMVR